MSDFEVLAEHSEDGLKLFVDGLHGGDKAQDCSSRVFEQFALLFGSEVEALGADAEEISFDAAAGPGRLDLDGVFGGIRRGDNGDAAKVVLAVKRVDLSGQGDKFGIRFGAEFHISSKRVLWP